MSDDAVVNLESSEESEGEGTNFWNWFNGGSSKHKAQKDLEALGSNTIDKTFPKVMARFLHIMLFKEELHCKRLMTSLLSCNAEAFELGQ